MRDHGAIPAATSAAPTPITIHHRSGVSIGGDHTGDDTISLGSVNC